ncbi:MAG: DUF3089 domain-containing protein [Acidimicrobiales bacterium]
MSLDPPLRFRSIVCAIAAIALLAGGCADDGDSGGGDAAGDKTTSTSTSAPTSTTEATAPEAEPFSGYSDHEAQLYAGTENWICHPDRASDECRDLQTTVVEADGSRRVDDLEPAEDPDFDCFYVYPTTSADPSPNSDLDVDASEIDTVKAQVARYASVCRVFAPAYRQITLTGLGSRAPDSGEIAYGDVLDAWKTYVNEFNEGRGVVLIGHSQGAGHLRAVLTDEIDPEPGLRSLLVSAVLLGSSVPEPGPGSDGGLQHVPACASSDESGCVISFSSFPAANPPVEGAFFGRVGEGEGRALCVDPAVLAGGDGLADVVLPSKSSLVGGVAGFEDITTPFVSLPASMRTECTETGPFSYLAVAPAEADDPRPLAGLVEERLGPAWGLHLLDANLLQGDLIEVVTAQAEARTG